MVKFSVLSQQLLFFIGQKPFLMNGFYFSLALAKPHEIPKEKCVARIFTGYVKVVINI